MGIAALVVRVAAGAVLVVFGLGKFVEHDDEVESFRFYGLPEPDAFTYAIGVVELGGGLLLLAGLVVRLSALVIAGDMVGAIAIAGPKEGGFVHFGVAPTLLAAMLFLLWAGPGAWSVDRRLLRPALD